MKKLRFLFIQIIFVLIFSLANAQMEEENVMIFTSPDFQNQGMIPIKHTCDGKDISPALAWSDVPSEAKSLVLIVDDPDAPDPAAPQRTWVHWVLYNIPVTYNALAQGIKKKALPKGTLEGLNDWGKTGYGGPCPPIGTHRYFHKLYALDILLPDLKNPTKAKLEEAMVGHVISKTELVGLYQR